MWFFMITCYVMSLLTFLSLTTGLFQSVFKFPVFSANHPVFMIFTSVLYCFTETLVIFFFVGTGVSIKEYTQQHNLPLTFRKESLKIKREVYPPLMMNMLYMIILFVLVGAVDTHRVPVYIYVPFFIFCVLDYIRIKWIQNQCFRKNTGLILRMSGLPDSHLSGSGPAEPVRPPASS